MSSWNFADVWEVVAQQIPEAPALIHGDRVVSWSEFDRRACCIASAFLSAGLGRQDKVAHYLYNCPEYLESLYAMWKVGMVPVNTNYRYVDDELIYLWDNADVVAVVFHGSFAATIERVKDRVAQVRYWLWVDDGAGHCPPWATPYGQVTNDPGSATRAPWARSGDDLFLLYTGGTTGMPKGVMWRQDDLFGLLNETVKLGYPEEGSPSDAALVVTRPGAVFVPACPLMHGTGVSGAIAVLSTGGCVVTLTKRAFSVDELLETIGHRQVQAVAIVGDTFAKPMLRALDESPGRWDISSLRSISSSGVMWSASTKDGLLRHNPHLTLIDSLGSSEALGIGRSVRRSSEAAGTTARFRASAKTRVISDDGRFVEAGSDEVGLVAVAGRHPIGYYKDEAKTAATFRMIDGMRFSIPGDYASIDADGTLTLVGRGSVCVNTGGEKVFPEEVEEVIKQHPAVNDAVVVGVPDDRFGEAVWAVVQAGDVPATDQEVIDHVKTRLAHYKAPKRLLWVQTLDRAANGKVDYKAWRLKAIEAAVA